MDGGVRGAGGGGAESKEKEDPLVSSANHFRLLHERLRENPIVGLGTSQRPKFTHIKRRVEKIRQQQQQVFLEQFQQFPDVDDSAQAEDYSTIWEAFQRKDDDVTSLTRKMQELNKLIAQNNGPK